MRRAWGVGGRGLGSLGSRAGYLPVEGLGEAAPPPPTPAPARHVLFEACSERPLCPGSCQGQDGIRAGARLWTGPACHPGACPGHGGLQDTWAPGV